MTPNNELTAAARDALDGFASGPASEAAEGVALAFERAGDRIADSLERAAKAGEFSFNALAESIAQDFARLAVDQLITAPLEGVIGSLTSAITGAVSGGATTRSSRAVTVNLLGGAQPTRTGPQPSQRQMAGRIATAVTKAGG